MALVEESYFSKKNNCIDRTCGLISIIMMATIFSIWLQLLLMILFCDHYFPFLFRRHCIKLRIPSCVSLSFNLEEYAANNLISQNEKESIGTPLFIDSATICDMKVSLGLKLLSSNELEESITNLPDQRFEQIVLIDFSLRTLDDIESQYPSNFKNV